MKNPQKFLELEKKIGKRLGSDTKGTILSLNEAYRECTDRDYNKRFPSKHDQIDTFQEGMESLLNFTDNYTRVPYGFISANHGRMVRDNYQDIYARNPLPDKFDRAYDSFKKATEYDY